MPALTNDVTTELNPWDQQPGEDTRWYARFDAYRRLGPARTIRAAYAAECASRGVVRRRSQSVPGSWDAAQARWRWAERAQAWDAAQLAQQRQADASAYRARLEAEQRAVLELAAQQRDLARELLTRLQARVRTLSGTDLRPDLIAGLARAASALATTAAGDAAAALGVEGLRSQLDALQQQLGQQGGGDGQ